VIKGLEGAAAEFLRDRYAGELTEREATTTVGTTISSIVESNPDRLGLLILNLSTNTVYVAIENNPSATNGIRLGANGGSVAFNVTDDGMIQTRAMFALATGAASSVYVLELTRFIADRQITSEEDTPLTEAV
tara:strand:- start:2705 stop:3103 length:399 start_codon:yes stop_codon:yes gene_type:complete